MKKNYIILLNIFLSIFTLIDSAETKKPKVSIITSVYKGNDFIAGFLSDITRMSIFPESELILINANSPDNEEPIIKEYMKKFPNIIYQKLDHDPGLYAIWNMAVKMAKSDFITNANLDDRRNPQALEDHIKFLETNPNIDLVYAGYFITNQANELFEFNHYRWFVESVVFTPKNMQLCLGGPMPTWRKSIHEKYGYFDEKFSSAGDFEMWLRAASQGAKFKNLEGYSGLYYQNPTGISTDSDTLKKAKRDQENNSIVTQYYAYWNSPDACFCTASDSNYFPLLINLIGSIHATNFDNINEIAVFDLGLEAEQINHLNTMKKVRVYEIEKANPDIIKSVVVNNWGKKVPGWYSFKPVAIKQALEMFETVLWVDAGTTILKPIDHLFKYIKQEGYFICTMGDELENNKLMHPVRWQTTKFLIDKFDLNSDENVWIMDQEIIGANFIGLSRKSYNEIALPFYELAKDIRNFIDDGTTPNGFGTARHDQTVFNIIAYLAKLKIYKQDYTQITPIDLPFDDTTYPFYITWHGHYVNDHTHVYNSRSDIRNFQENKSRIIYK
ncbi:MAG: glycosyltransferase [Candidatus Babeliales bacterium]|nr:glycosyltransferase [Candidatus Babeliales bacterium]